MTDRHALEVNRAHWDALASAHGGNAYYDTDALVAGADALDEHEEAAVREPRAIPAASSWAGRTTAGSGCG